MWLVDLNYNFECDWLIELSDNKLSDNKLSNNKLVFISLIKIHIKCYTNLNLKFPKNAQRENTLITLITNS